MPDTGQPQSRRGSGGVQEDFLAQDRERVLNIHKKADAVVRHRHRSRRHGLVGGMGFGGGGFAPPPTEAAAVKHDPVDDALSAAAGIFRGGKPPWDQRRALTVGWRARADAEVFDPKSGEPSVVPSLIKATSSEECWEAAQRGDSFLVAELIGKGADPARQHCAEH